MRECEAHSSRNCQSQVAVPESPQAEVEGATFSLQPGVSDRRACVSTKTVMAKMRGTATSKWRGFTRAAATPDHLSAACVDVWSFPLWSGRSVKDDMIDHRWGTGRRVHSHSSWPPVRARFPNWSKRTGAGGGALPRRRPLEQLGTRQPPQRTR